MLVRRTVRLWQAVTSSNLTELEADHAREMLDLERESLRAQVVRFNAGLAGHAGLIQGLKSERGRLEKESRELEPRLRLRLARGDREAAGRCALRMEENAERTRTLGEEIEGAERTYRELLRARELAVARARERMDTLKRSIDACKVQEALAELTEQSSGMSGALGVSDGSMDRICARLDERRNRAAGRVRVARDAIEYATIEELEDDRAALAADALQRFQLRGSSSER